VTAALLLVFCAALAPPPPQITTASPRPDLRVTRTLTGTRLRISGIAAPSVDLFVVGGPGLRVFRQQHLEPQWDGSFAADLALGDAGLYMAFAEFVAASGWPQVAQQVFTTGSPLGERPGDPVDEPHVSNGIRAAMDASGVKSGGKSRLRFDVSDEASGTPVTDLEGYLGAPAHLFVVSADLTEAQHLIPDEGHGGPRLSFSPIFPRSGRYKLWLEMRRADRVATVPFVIDVH
jgi:hypothetical protein